MKKTNEVRYLVSDVVSVPVIRIAGKTDAYKYATKPGWGVVEWYSAINDYKAPVNRDPHDKTQQLVCDEDTSAVLYSRYGQEFCIFPYDEINVKEMPRQAELDAIIISDACGFSFWAADDTDVKIFVTYTEDGLIDTYRLDNWNAKPEEGETEITFADLQSEADHDNTDRADIPGTFEHSRKLEAAAQTPGETNPPAATNNSLKVMWDIHGWIEGKQGNIHRYTKDISTISEGFQFKRDNDLYEVTFLYEPPTGRARTESVFGKLTPEREQETLRTLRFLWRGSMTEADYNTMLQ